MSKIKKSPTEAKRDLESWWFENWQNYVDINADDEEGFIRMDETLELAVTYIPENATDPGLTWESSDESIMYVEVQEGGLTAIVTPVALGTATVTVRTNDGSELSASCEIEVAPTFVESLMLDVDSLTMFVNDELQINAIIEPSYATDPTVTWESSGTEIVEIQPIEGNSVIVIARGVGTAVITAYTNDGTELTASCVVEVLPILVESLTLDVDSATMFVDDELQITAFIEPDYATNPTITWESSDPEVVDLLTMEENVVTIVARGAGTSIITAYTNDGSELSASCIIEVLSLGVFGDVNCDGVVTSVDITCLYNYLLNGDETYIATSDVDGDGFVTAADITVIYNILLGE